MQALLLGSIGVVVETSELQRQAYNTAFAEHGLDWYWSVGNYCELLKAPGGMKRLSAFSNGKLSDELLFKIHETKQNCFETLLDNGIKPRPGVAECLNYCFGENIKVAFVTTTTRRNIQILESSLSKYIDFKQFDLITTKQDVVNEKPSSEIYRFALQTLNVRAQDSIAIEDTEVNQEAALEAEILCYLYAGEYTATKHNINLIKSLDIISRELAVG